MTTTLLSRHDQQIAIREQLDFHLSKRDARIADLMARDQISVEAATQLVDADIQDAVERFAFASLPLYGGTTPAPAQQTATVPQSNVSDRSIIFDHLTESGLSSDRAFRLLEDPATLAAHVDVIADYRRHEADRLARAADRAYAESPEGRRALARKAIEDRQRLAEDAKLAREYLLATEQVSEADLDRGLEEGLLDDARLIEMAGFNERAVVEVPLSDGDRQFLAKSDSYGLAHALNDELRDDYEAKSQAAQPAPAATGEVS